MNDHQQPVRSRTENATKNFNTSANGIHRIAASPRQIKTQIAKISYTSPLKALKKQHTKKQLSKLQQFEDNSTDPELGSINVTDRTRNDFGKKKEEREKEFSDLKLYLNEIANNKPDDKSKDRETGKGSIILKNNDQEQHESSTIKNGPTFRRSKTEIIGTKPRSRSERNAKTRIGAKARSKSSQPPETKSHELLPTVPRGEKRKSYNVEEARKFLEEQKRRRRSQQAASSIKAQQKTALEKEQIKNRLEELRKNSRAIITKNFNRKKISSSKSTENNTKNKEKSNETKIDCVLITTDKIRKDCGESVGDVYDNKSAKFAMDALSSKLTNDKISQVAPGDQPKAQHIDSAKDTAINEECKTRSAHSSFSDKKRIGLLRKQELKDHSFSAITEFSFDKENIALEMMTPKLHQAVPYEPSAISKDKDITTKVKKLKENPVEITYRKPKNNLERSETDEPKNVGISQANTSNSTQIRNDTTQSKLDFKIESIPQSDLPYWLKPSAVQIYPYNFIMAVRRKLEALADVKQLSARKITSSKDLTMEKLESDATFVPKASNKSFPESIKHSGKFESKKLLPEEFVLDCAIEPEKVVSQNTSILNPKNCTAQSQSELNSNLSSISIQLMPSSNTVSETTSKKSKSIPLTYRQSKASALPSEDDTTISSSIFNSPEKNIANINGNTNENVPRAISPLCLERVENLMITSNKKLKRAIAARHVNTNRGGDILQCDKMDQSLVHKDIQEIDFSKLLVDFNRSLSQVIEVNDRLKSTLNKSDEICFSQSGSIKDPEYNSPKESGEYTDDFEKNSSERSQDVNTEVQNEKDRNQAYNKRTNQMHENEVTKSDTHRLKQADECSTNHYAISQSQNNSSISSLNSNVSSEVSQKNPFPTAEVFSHEELYKRLHKIEKVKEKFKQTVLSSPKIRLTEDCVRKTEPNMENGNLEIGDQKNSERVVLFLPSKEPTNPANTTEQKESLNSDSIAEEIQIEGKIEIEKNGKKTTTLIRKRTDPGDLSSKYVNASRKILEIFDHSSLEISLGSSNNDSLSDSTCSYSNVGLYEKLIRNETTKSEHLTALLKMREKALFDRTKGQIAWLEVQKERCKSKGLLLQISAIKKKQRGILLKMEKEREEIKRLLQSTTTTTSTESSANRASKEFLRSPKESDKSVVSQKSSSTISHKITQLSRNDKRHTALVSFPQPASVSTLSKYARGIAQPKVNVESTRPVPVVRANYGLESTRSLEELLKKRESDLRRRREHVERLMQWHRRLDQEEAEVLQMENALITYNTENNKLSKPLITDEVMKEPLDHAGVVPIRNICTHTKVHRRLKAIENSLRELNSISSTHTTAGSNRGSEEEIKSNAIDCVRTTGNKLNKLWRRLTSQQIEKYEPNKYYQLSKPDLERLYEAAKVAVLQDFAQNEGSLTADLLEKSISIFSNNISETSSQQVQQLPETVLVPSLNLCTSSEPSDKEEESWEETSANSLLLGNYSPCTAAENFQLSARLSGSATLCSTITQASSEANILLIKNKSELNLHSDMRNFSPHINHDVGLVRSLSDSVLYNKNRSLKCSKKSKLNSNKDSYAENSSLSMSKTEDLPPYDAQAKVNSPLPSNTEQQTLLEQANESLTSGTQNITLTSSLQTERPTVITASDSSGGTATKAGAQIEDISVEDNKLSTSTESLIHISYDEVNSATEAEDIPSSSQHIISYVHSSYSCEIDNEDTPQQSLSCIISTASLREQFQNDSSDSNQAQSVGEQESLNSKAFVSQSKLIQCEETPTGNETLNTYEDDFESTCELTQIDDLSLPHFESIVDASLPDENVNEGIGENEIENNQNKNVYIDVEVPICLGVSEKPSKTPTLLANTETIPAPQSLPSPTDSTRLQSTAQNTNNEIPIAVSSVQLMPDIINELEIRRCQQMRLENEQMKQFDNSSTVMPYMYVREIPNKPPPPYVPPAHGSPMTTIFPSEERIKEISYRRTHELYCELSKTDYISETGEKLPSVMDEKITNIYERIILDMCREYLDEHSEVLKQGDPINFYTQLAFFNPPNRLRCMQESVYKEVRRCLAMDKTTKRRTPIYSVYGQRAMRDHIGKIIIQEMYDEDEKWCNFHREENEVVELIIYEMVGTLLTDLAKEVLIEEGGTVEISNRDNEDESDENLNSSSHEAE